MEFLRRLIVVIFVCTALWLVFYTPLIPLVRVKPVDFAADFKKETDRPKRTLKSLLPDNPKSPVNYEQFIAQKTGGKVFRAEGEEWGKFFQDITTAYHAKGSSRELERRASSHYRNAGFYFHAYERPFDTLQDRLNRNLDVLYLSRPDGEYLKVDYRAYTLSSFHIGTGLSDYPKPPSWLMYPYRGYTPWILLAGLASYILLRGKRKEKDSVHFKGWFIAGNDICFVILLIALPFVAPMAIMGGSMQVFFTEGIFLLPLFWLIAAIGVWGFVFVMPGFACFQMKISDGGIRIVDTKSERLYQFDEMRYFQWVTFKRPRWMMWFAWVFLLSGRSGGISLFVLSTLTHAGIGIEMRDGTFFYLNTSNPMGQSVLNQRAGEIAMLLHNHGVIERREEMTIRTLALEPVGSLRARR